MPVELISAKQVLRERLERDPEFRAEWERTALARAVSVALVKYRADHGLSQRQLAKQLRMPQPQIARLEVGEYNPSVETLQRLARGLDQRFIVAVIPASKTGELDPPKGVEVLTDIVLSDGSRLLAAAG